MSKISIDLIWSLNEGKMSPGKYSNQHEIIFTPNMKIIADSAPDWRGSELNSNPEQTLAASLSSCHMMTFLALAAKMNWPVINYKDNAIATLGKTWLKFKYDLLRSGAFADDTWTWKAFKQAGALCPIPGHATHLQDGCITPVINWEMVYDSIRY